MGKICFLFVTQRSSNNTLYIMFQCIMYHIVFTFIVNPEEENRNKQQLKIRKAKGLYKPDRAKLTKSVREYRRYKQKLFLEGKIQLTNSQ